MDPTITIVVQGLVFFAVAWLVMKFGWPNIIAAIEDRQKKIAEGLAAAERGEKSLVEAKNSAADIIKEAHVRAARIVEQATRRSVEMTEEARGVASAKAERLIANARQEATMESGRAREELRKEAANLAVFGATKLLGREIDSKAHADLLDKLALEIEHAA
jgi:F-type H+-transporting ATPase subunit b